MQHINPEYNFTTVQDGEFTNFTYQKTPISYKAAGPLCIVTFVPAMFIVAMSHPDTFASAVISWLVVMIGLSALIVFIINSLRKPGEIRVSKASLIVNDKTYQLDHVSSFIIKDPNGLYMNNTVIVQGRHNPFTLAGGAANVGNAFANLVRECGQSIRKHILEAGFKIVIRYGTKNVIIAKGLGETEAEVLFEKLTGIAGYK